MAKTEDVVREQAGQVLGFIDTETAKSGVGQLTSFNSLDFKGVKDRPDGWYLPNETIFPAIILEAKGESTELKQPHIDELFKNLKIVETKYKDHVGILYNGVEIKVFKNFIELPSQTNLKNKEYYLHLFNQNKIDKNKIYELTKKINDSLHFDFGMKNLNHRMIFTACALVAKRYGAPLAKGMDYNTFHTCIHSQLSKSLQESIKINTKLVLLLETFAAIKMNYTENQEAINNFIKNVAEISDNINSDFWQGEDVMAIFFNEFTRYKGKPEQGQVFTPDHITSLMYAITETTSNDIVLDACCGSGAFLVKAMCNMVNEVGGNNTDDAKLIKQCHLYGVEFDNELYALACANMLIHKDGKTNIEKGDTRTAEIGKWIKQKKITRVLMNPPYENRYGCLEIVKNVLGNVEVGAICAFILPDNKLVVNDKVARRLLLKHTLQKIIKLPDVFGGMAGVSTSIFIFKAGLPQNNAEIFACWIKDDGFETVKNQGRHDIKSKWNDIEDSWVEIIKKQVGDDSIQWLDPNKNLSYKLPEKPFQISEQDFKKKVLEYVLFESQISEQDFKIVIENIKEKK
ncbi:MAG: N-6 DNA methylase [Clostridiaceae bacterium]|nr:N-6 DNA methylase [Clostridiaceae bacterium]